MELHFFPSQNILAVKDGTRYIGQYGAWGGPASKGFDPYMAEEPTWPGVYVIHGVEKYSTPTWPLSKIKWGVRLIDMPKLDDVYYELPSKRLASIKKDVGISRRELMQLHQMYYKQMKIPPKWVFNDFGPIAIRWFKDQNGNKILDKNERLSGQMFHTTPQNEAEQSLGLSVNLTPSHGCIHLKPADRDFLLGSGAFSPKTTLIVHRYDEKI